MIPLNPFYALATRNTPNGREKYPVQVGITRENAFDAQLVVLVRRGAYAYAEFVNDVELEEPEAK